MRSILSLLFLGITFAHAQVTDIRIGKGRSHFQAQAGALAAIPACGAYCFQFNAWVSGASTAPVLARPIGGTKTFTNGIGTYWTLDEMFTSAVQLEASYPSGTYGVTADSASYSITVGGDAYPNAPVFTLSGGDWVGGQYVIDPARPLTFSTNGFTAYGARPDNSLHVYLGREGHHYFDTWVYSGSTPSPPSSYTIPAGTLASGREYYLSAGYYAVAERHPGPPSREAFYAAYTSLTVKAESPPPVFPIQVTSNITPTVANATAVFQPRPQDVGQTASVYVFAVAPATLVQGSALLKGWAPTWTAKTAPKVDAPVQCLLAQLNASGQLRAVSAAGLTAFVTGTLGAQGQAVTILDNVATPNIAGSTFYVGYGTSSQQMIASGVNQRALAVAGDVICAPQPPQTGWWYNPEEGGRGFSVEARGRQLFMAAFHYDPDGRATWNFAGGVTSLDGSLFTADFLSASGGQTLTGPYQLPSLGNAGTVTFAFSDATRGTMIWPGGTTAIERQAFVPDGLTTPAQANLPESGWWWNPAESGRGFFIEWQAGYVDIAGYMYDAQGRPTWYISAVPTPDPMRITGTWWTFAGGQAMGQPYRPATRTSDNAGALDVRFTSATTATMTLPDGRQITLVRQAF